MHFNKELARLCARASKGVYTNADKAANVFGKSNLRHKIKYNAIPKEFNLLFGDKIVGTPRDVASICSDDDKVYVIFRGSMMPSNEEIIDLQFFANLLNDWCANLKWGMVDHSDLKGKVSRGFSEYNDSMWRDIKNCVDEHYTTDKKIVFAGHSLGGAQAILSACRFRDTVGYDPRDMIVYTFGAPKTGNSKFKQAYDNISIYRVETSLDIVPALPPDPTLIGSAVKSLTELTNGVDSFLGDICNNVFGCRFNTKGEFATNVKAYEHIGHRYLPQEDGTFLTCDGVAWKKTALDFYKDVGRGVSFVQLKWLEWLKSHLMDKYISSIR